MPRGRRNNYNYYYPQRSIAAGKRNKYSSMTYFVTNETASNKPGYMPYFIVVPPANIGGKRKVKNISIQLSFDSQYMDDEGVIQNSGDTQILWAIVYVPKGSTPGTLNYQNGIFYSPPQFIMASGIYDTNQPGNSSRIFTPLSRNLNEGDGIAFVYQRFNNAEILYGHQLKAIINYAITLQ